MDYYEEYLEIERVANKCIEKHLRENNLPYRFISNKDLQKKGIDLITKEGNIDIKAHTYRNDYLVLELCQKSDEGWLYKEGSLTKYVWWCTLSNDKVTVIDYEKLKKFDHKKYKRHKTINTEAYFKLIPLEDLSECIVDVFEVDFFLCYPYLKNSRF